MSTITKIAIKKAGGPRIVGAELGVTKQAVLKWEEVPAKHVLTIERLSGVTRYELRPDIYGPHPGPFARATSAVF